MVSTTFFERYEHKRRIHHVDQKGISESDIQAGIGMVSKGHPGEERRVKHSKTFNIPGRENALCCGYDELAGA